MTFLAPIIYTIENVIRWLVILGTMMFVLVWFGTTTQSVTESELVAREKVQLATTKAEFTAWHAAATAATAATAAATASS